MNVKKIQLPKSQVELQVELSSKEFAPYIKKGAEKISQEIKIEGFRQGKAPYDVLKRKIGEMTILEEAAKIAINKTINKILKENIKKQAVGQPQVDITKLAPDNPLEYKIVISVLPNIELGSYKNLKIKKKEVKEQPEELNKMLNNLREMRAKEKISNKSIAEGDKALVDLNMFLDKVPIEGGQSKDTAVIIGKEYLVPGFDKNLIGAKKGETKKFNLPYPKNHYMKNLAGKMVEFQVKIKEVYEREIPKLDNDLAKSMGAKNIEELKESIRKNLAEEKKREIEQKYESEIIEKITAKTKFEELPEILIESEAKNMLTELEQTIQSQGGKFEDYLSSIHKTRDQLLLEMVPAALKRVKGALVIREIALKEKINASEKEIEEKTQELLEQYKGYKSVEEKVKDPNYKIFLQNSLTNQKVIKKLKEWNIEKNN